MGILYVRQGGPAGSWIPITGIGTNPGLTKTEADGLYVNVAGDTMTGPLTMGGSGAGGGYIMMSTPSGTSWVIDGAGNEFRIHRNGLLGIDVSPDAKVVALGTGGAKVGQHPSHGNACFWQSGRDAQGQYIALGIGGDSFFNAETTGHLRIGNSEVCYWNNTGFRSNLNLGIMGQQHLLFETYGGGWYMVDGTYIRASNNKAIYTAGLIRGDSGFQCGSNYMVTNYQDTDSGLYWWGDGNVGLVVNGLGIIQCSGVTTTTYELATQSQYRITSNGGNGAAYHNHAFLAQNGAAARTGYSMHPGGVAKTMEMMQNNGYVNFINEDGGGYAQLYCWDVTQVSQRKMKQDITSWPPRSAGSAVMGAASRLSLIDVIRYRQLEDHALIDAETMERHECGPDSCGCTVEDPCHRVKEWSNPMLGIIIEDLATVLPEAVGLDPDGKPGGMRVGTMIGYLLAVCKEQQERIEALEQNYQEAA